MVADSLIPLSRYRNPFSGFVLAAFFNRSIIYAGLEGSENADSAMAAV